MFIELKSKSTNLNCVHNLPIIILVDVAVSHKNNINSSAHDISMDSILNAKSSSKCKKYKSVLDGKAELIPAIISSSGIFHADFTKLIISIVNNGFQSSYYDRDFQTQSNVIRNIKDDIIISLARGNAKIIAAALQINPWNCTWN